MVSALLHVDIADSSWFRPDTTVEIEVDLEEHVFRRAVLGNDVRGVFATYREKRVMLLRDASEEFRWNPGCAVSLVAPDDGNWGDGEAALEALRLEYVGKAFVEIPGWQGGDRVVVSALLHVDIADSSWFSPGTTVEIEVDLEEHVFRRAFLGNEVRGVFATYRDRRIMLLRKAREDFRWAAGCAVSVAVPSDGQWRDGGTELGHLDLEDIAKAVVEVPGQRSEPTA